jgi:HAE1 family hydrophobic/amphiphilic exporter-1
MAQVRISAWAIKNPAPVALLFIALVIAGLVYYTKLPIKNLPDVEFPGAAVTAVLPGASPAEMENQVTRPIENAMAGIANVETIQSVVTEGVSTTVIQFHMGTEIQKSTDDVRAKVDQVRSQLPREVDQPQVSRLEIAGGSIATYAVQAPDMSMLDLSWFIDDSLTRRLQALGGVGSVSRVGGLTRVVNIILDPVKMAAAGVTAPQINAALNAVTNDAPGGQVTVGGRQQTVRVMGAATTAEQIRNLTISVSGRDVKMADIAEVGDGSTERAQYALLDGRPVVGFSVSKTKEASDVDVETRVQKEIAKIAAEHPGMSITKIVSSVDETRQAFHATQAAMFEGMALAALVVFLFLRDWRATAITALAMPVSLIPTFAVMGILGFSLNTITLLALTLVIGILVDDAIVEIENIEKRVQAGVRPYQAAYEGADQIGLAVVATTFAIFMVFAPVAFMPGIPGKFFKEFGLTVSVAVLFSLVVARLLTPLLAAYFLKPRKAHPRRPLPAIYRNTLRWSLDHKILACLIGAVLFFVGVYGIAILPKGLSPEPNADYYTVNIETAPGSTLEETGAIAQHVVEVFQKRPETAHIFQQIGFGSTSSGGIASGTGSPDRATVTAILHHDRALSIVQLRDALREPLGNVPDARVTYAGSNFGSGSTQTLLVSDTGENLDEAALELQKQMATLKSVGSIRTSSPPAGPELVIRPRLDEAARLGVTTQAIAQVARIATAGDIDANTPKLNQGERRIPVRVRLRRDVRSDLAAIRNLQIPTATGGFTSLGSVADVDFEAAPSQIDRFDRKRQITVVADLVGGAQLGDVANQINNLPIMKHLPPGVHPAAQGEQQALVQLVGGFIIALFSGVGLVYAVMVLLFQSFFKPVTILFALPLAIVGGALGLWVMGLQIDMPSLIGFLMLMGLAAKNSILLVEYAIESERAGASRREAMLEATRERARPIVMTSLAMMGGMLPTALGIGQGAEFRQPMAVAVIGGLITSTVLSLVLVPVVYEIVDAFEDWIRPLLGKMITPREAPKPAE